MVPDIAEISFIHYVICFPKGQSVANLLKYFLLFVSRWSLGDYPLERKTKIQIIFKLFEIKWGFSIGGQRSNHPLWIWNSYKMRLNLTKVNFRRKSNLGKGYKSRFFRKIMHEISGDLIFKTTIVIKSFFKIVRRTIYTHGRIVTIFLLDPYMIVDGIVEKIISLTRLWAWNWK